MKVFQIFNNICYYDMTPIHPTLEDTVGKYPPDVLIVEAPDYVFEHWGFDETLEGDDRFIRPEAPEGWTYDDETGAFIPDDATLLQDPVETDLFQQEQSLDALLAAKAELEAQIQALEAPIQGGTENG